MQRKEPHGWEVDFHRFPQWDLLILEVQLCHQKNRAGRPDTGTATQRSELRSAAVKSRWQRLQQKNLGVLGEMLGRLKMKDSLVIWLNGATNFETQASTIIWILDSCFVSKDPPPFGCPRHTLASADKSSRNLCA